MTELFLNLVNISITAGYLVVAVILLRMLLVKAPKYIRYILWGLVGIRLLVPVSIESVFSLIPSREVVPQDIVYQEEPMVHVGIESVDNLVNPILTENFAANPVESVNPMQVVTEVASYVWIMGIILLLGYTIFSYINLKKRVWDATKLQDNVFQSERITSPFVLGIFKPAIYVPYNLSETECDCVLTHERIHIRRKDYLIKPLAFLLLTVYWFNPLLWIAYVLLCKDIELSCDEKAIAELGEGAKKDYSETLLNLCISNHAITACPIAFGETSVKSRIKNVINYKKPTVWIVLVSVIAIVVVAICFMTNPQKEYLVGIEVPAGSEEHFVYSDEEISSSTGRITISSAEGLGDTEVVLLPIEYKEENIYEPSYLTPGLPVKLEAEKDAWFKVGVNIQNPTNEDKKVYVAVKGVEIRIADSAEETIESFRATTEASSTETEETSLPQLPMKEQLKEEIMNTLGIPVVFTPNDNWIEVLSYQCDGDRKAEVQYRDDILGSVCDLQVVRDGEPELPDWTFDDNLEESWEGYTKSNQYVAIKVQITEDGKNALVTWKYEEYQFAIQSALLEGGTDLVSSIPKVAIHIIQNLD